MALSWSWPPSSLSTIDDEQRKVLKNTHILLELIVLSLDRAGIDRKWSLSSRGKGSEPVSGVDNTVPCKKFDHKHKSRLSSPKTSPQPRVTLTIVSSLVKYSYVPLRLLRQNIPASFPLPAFFDVLLWRDDDNNDGNNLSLLSCCCAPPDQGRGGGIYEQQGECIVRIPLVVFGCSSFA